MYEVWKVIHNGETLAEEYPSSDDAYAAVESIAEGNEGRHKFEVLHTEYDSDTDEVINETLDFPTHYENGAALGWSFS